MKTFARKWLLPPGINQLLTDAPPSVKRLWGGQSSRPKFDRLNPSRQRAASLTDLLVAPYAEIVWVDTDKICRSGRAFTWQQNQHVRYFKDGFESYRRFFELHQPRNQFEELMLDDSKVGYFAPVRFPRNRKPWSFEKEYLGEDHLGASHGTQDHGPVSEKKLAWEKKRLDTIRASVGKRGFAKVNYYDFIRFGEILVDDSDPNQLQYRVCVDAGIHRVSLLSHLGWPLIPMMPDFTRKWREVRLSDRPRWPGVLDGTFSPGAATAYFLAHFRDPAEELLPGW